jgi:hypothetical protein
MAFKPQMCELILWSSRREGGTASARTAACTVRAELLVSESKQIDAMISAGRRFLEAFCGRALLRERIIRCDAAEPGFRDWQWPMIVTRPEDIGSAIGAFPLEESPEGEEVYPISLWLFSPHNRTAAELVIDSFRDNPGSATLAAKLLTTGVSRISIFRNTLHISCRRDQCLDFESDLVEAAGATGWEARWP